MVGLVIEKMHQQGAERLAGRRAAHVVVVQAMVEVGFAQGVDPIDDQLVQPTPPGGEFIQVGERQLLEVRRCGNAAQRRQRRVAGGVQGKAFEPDGVAQREMVERAEDRAEKRVAVHAQLIVRKPGSRVIDLAVHPLVVGRQQRHLFDTVHVLYPSLAMVPPS